MLITTSEWEIMRVLWSKDYLKSSEIIAVLYRKLGWSDSTIKTLLRRLVEKGAASRFKEGKTYYYRATVSERAAYSAELQSVLNRICVTEHSNLLQEMLSDLPMTHLDILQFEALLAEKKDKVVDRVVCDCIVGQCRCHSKEEYHGN